MNLQSLSRQELTLGGLALLLVVDLVALPWFSISVGPFSADFTATDAPDGWVGVLAVLAAIALIADVTIERFSPTTTVPAIGGSRGQTRLVLAAVTAGLVALKFILHIHFSLFGFGFWAAVVLAAALVYVALQSRNVLA